MLGRRLFAHRLLARGPHHLEVAQRLGLRPETAGECCTARSMVARGCPTGIIEPMPRGPRDAPPAHFA